MMLLWIFVKFVCLFDERVGTKEKGSARRAKMAHGVAIDGHKQPNLGYACAAFMKDSAFLANQLDDFFLTSL